MMLTTKETVKNLKGVIWKKTSIEGVYACNYGIFFNIRTKRFSKAQRYKKGYYVVINRKTYNAARIMYEAFNGAIPDGFVVYSTLRLKDLDIHHLKAIPKSEFAAIAGSCNSVNQMVEVRDLENNYIGTFRSYRKAATILHISYQTVMEYANGKVKKPMYQIKKIRGN